MSDDPGLKLVTAVTASVVLTLLICVLIYASPGRALSTPSAPPSPVADAQPAWQLGQLRWTRDAEHFRLQGQVPDHATRERLISAVQRVHPELQLDVEALRLDPAAPAPEWRDGLLGPLARLRTLPTYTLTLADPIRLDTTLSSDQGRAAWVDYLSRFATDTATAVDSSGIAIDPLAAMVPTDPDLLFVWRPDYASGSAALPPEAQAELPLIADLLAREPGLIRIIGHTDELGDPGSNKSLSGERAEAVRLALRRAGLPAEKLVSMGRGQDVPGQASATDRPATHRRIEFAR
ncbi:MAG: OmpA family protein [Xanthomonadales bacterium]|jgi:hypothetical protein|nr:OmpA family protein [Xanthomonadales bacterium]